MRLRAPPGTVLPADLARHNRLTHLLFSKIVGWRHSLVVEKGQQLATKVLQTFRQSPCIIVIVRIDNQLIESLVDAAFSPFKHPVVKFLTLIVETHGVFQ